MAVTHLGEKTVGQVCIGIAIAVPALGAALTDLLSRIAGLQGQITKNLSLIATPPNPADLAASLAAAAASVVTKIADIVAAIPGPLVQANLQLGADVAALTALKTTIETAVTTLTGAISAGGIHVYSIDAVAASLGGEIATAVGGGLPGGLPNERVQGVMYLTRSPAALSALSTLQLL